MKAVPGRKTDVKNAEWICQLLRHGLIKASFIPDRDQRELRELVRYRRSIIEERARQHNRIQKVLEGANIKLGSVVSDIMGVSSKNMLRAIADGIDDPEELASMAQRTLKRKKDELELALQGYTSPPYYLLTRKEMYVDLGEDYFDKQRQQSIVRHAVRRLEGLGYSVTITEPEAS
jgi:transposase